MDIGEKALKLHRDNKGKIEVISKVPVKTREDLSLAYTPGVARPCLEIAADKNKSYEYTARGNMVAVISDGSAVLGLGNIGPLAAMPVMEGKALLFKEFADVDAFPICLDTQDADEIVRTVELLAPSFGGINLEDISAPRCFDIEDRLKQKLDIPIFHDDQHGTAVVVAAALTNAFKLTGRDIKTSKIVINGIGAAGSAIARLLLNMGAKEMVLCDKHGIIVPGDKENNQMHQMLSKIVNPNKIKGDLSDAMIDADVFIGVSAPGIVTKEMVSSMKDKSIVMAMANPTPEIMPELAKEAGAYVICTGRSDFPNQVNNVLAFPGIFRGTLDVGACEINEAMKLAAAKAIAGLVSDDELSSEYIIPEPLDKRVCKAVAEKVMQAAKDSGAVGRIVNG